MGLFLSAEEKELLNEEKKEIAKQEKFLQNEEKKKLNDITTEKLYKEFGIPTSYKINNNSKKFIVRSFYDNDSGYTTTEMLEIMLNYYLENGYKLYKIYTNIVGVNSSSSGAGINGVGMTRGTNATIEQTIVIFERMN